jgi:uncharacterized protein Yka (UPF0111/DUF47 family)
MASIVDLGIRANSVAAKMLEANSADEINRLNQELVDLEKKSDEMAFSISEALSVGAISSNVLGKLLEAVDMCDSILDNFHRIGREIRRSFRPGVDCSHSEFFPQFSELLSLQQKALRLLKDLLCSGDIVRMQEIRLEIEKLEEEGDDIKDMAFDKLYSLAHSMHFLTFIHISEILHMLDDVLDGCEDISDVALAVAHSISK